MTRRTGLLAMVAVAAGALAANAASCGGSDTSPGSGGTGGAATTSTGGAGGAGGAFGACPSSIPSCMAITDCPPTQNECVDTTCDQRCCGTVDVAAMTPTASQTPGDCMEVVCDGKGGTTMIADDTDVPDDMNPCVADSCSMGMPVRTPVAGACTANGGTVCGDPSGTSAGQCVACNTTADCKSAEVCIGVACYPSTCADGTQDDGETDVDCGGGVCPGCAPGKVCMVNSDCASDVCLADDTCM